MYRGGASRIFPILLVIVVVIVAIIALVALGRALFGGSDNVVDSSPDRRALLTTDADHSVRMTVRGPIVAEEDVRSYQIDISPVNRRMTTYKGYESQRIDNKEFTNNSAAYVEFVYALEKFNFLKEARLTDDQDDTRGVCATGRLYTFEIMEAQSSIKRLWTSSCGEPKGSFQGNAEGTRDLFLRQIPGSEDVLETIDLSV